MARACVHASRKQTDQFGAIVKGDVPRSLPNTNRYLLCGCVTLGLGSTQAMQHRGCAAQAQSGARTPAGRMACVIT